ncbi:phosphatidylglycerol lysyltransferase domain-containing protein [Candidatus Clostridium radicumherbarum]|uniref:Phosphatidylglycerol lysyltransferase domain-containing protein n=1 Tax=Candidatus Clostridium radicumherbarum TaxID=3381662 RepID=A0ABW8TSC2_9CLOT
MKKITSWNVKDALINMTVILIILIGIESILIGYNHRLEILTDIGNYSFINPKTLQFHRILSVIIGFGLIFISYRLFKRMRMAWIISVCMVSILTFMHIFRGGRTFRPTVIIELMVIVILVSNYKKFKRASDPLSLRNGILLGLTVIAIILLNTCFTIYVLKIKISTVNGVYDAVSNTLKMLFLIDPSVLGRVSRIKLVIAKSGIVINWIGIIAAFLFILKPLVYQPIVTGYDKEKVRKLLKEYGDNPLSYVSIENDKKYYFGKDIEGVIAYTIAAGVAVCAGDPICSDENLPFLLTEFITYCKQNDLEICFCNTLEKHILLYKQFGFGVTKYGEEAMFELNTYNLKGGKAAKIRNAINHASALGITVSEYKSLEHRDKLVEQEIENISKEWLKDKKSSELSFMLGTTSIDNPMDRRYFTAYDSEHKMLGFIVFSPFLGGKGYYADVTRRKSDAPIGVMEKITIEAFEKMKLEGAKWGSLGLAPLANAADDGKVTGKLLDFVYEKLNSFYGFKSLYHYKKKYGPTSWEPRYLVYYPKLFTPKIAYSIIKAQNPKGVGDFILTQLKSIFNVNK